MNQSAYIAELEAKVSQLTEQLSQALVRNGELERRLSKNSCNADKSPSSDGLAKKPAIPRQRSLRKPGGQRGHAGKTLNAVAQPDCEQLHRIVSQ